VTKFEQFEEIVGQKVENMTKQRQNPGWHKPNRLTFGLVTGTFPNDTLSPAGQQQARHMC